IAGELKIDMASNITKTFSNKAPVRVKIYTPNFNELDMDGLTKTLLSGFNDSNAKIKLDGSSDLKLENNTFAFLQLDVDGISKVEGYAMVENARIKVDGTSK